MEIGDTGESRDPWDTGVSWGHKGHNGTHETQGDTRDIRDTGDRRDTGSPWDTRNTGDTRDTGDTKAHMGRR